MIFLQCPECTGEELTNNLIEQIKAFKTNFHLNERVEEIKKVEKKWITKTNKGTEFEVIKYNYCSRCRFF